MLFPIGTSKVNSPRFWLTVLDAAAAAAADDDDVGGKVVETSA